MSAITDSNGWRRVKDFGDYLAQMRDLANCVAEHVLECAFAKAESNVKFSRNVAKRERISSGFKFIKCGLIWMNLGFGLDYG